jgi:hypothetical protein
MSKSRRNLNDPPTGSMAGDMSNDDSATPTPPANGLTPRSSTSKRRGRKSVSGVQLQEQVDEQLAKESS